MAVEGNSGQQLVYSAKGLLKIGLGRRGKEVPAAVPFLDAFRIHLSQIGFVDHGGRLERLARLLVRQSLCGQLAKFVVHERQEQLGGVPVALLDGGKYLSDVFHSDYGLGSRPRTASPQALT